MTVAKASKSETAVYVRMTSVQHARNRSGAMGVLAYVSMVVTY